jgi:enamine deaminase RidA (YjgF/YER057c/UK114 family)
MSRAALAALILLVLGGCGPAAAPASSPGGQGRIYPMAPPAPEFLQAPTVPAIAGFSSAVKVGQTVYLAGQVPLDSTGLLVGRGDRTLQLRQALANASAVVRYARGVPADIIRLTVYCVACSPQDFDDLRGEAAGLFPKDEGAALTMLGVAALPEPELLVAVDAVAVLRGAYPDRNRDPGTTPQ